MLYTRSVDKTVGAGASAGDVALPQLTIGDTADKEWQSWQTAAQNTQLFSIINKIHKDLKKFVTIT